MVHQHFMLIDTFTAVENIVMGTETLEVVLKLNESEKKIQSLCDQYEIELDLKAKIWQLFGRSGKGNLCGVVLRRLVTSRKGQFRWRNPEINPYIARDEERNTVTSRYDDVAMAMSHA